MNANMERSMDKQLLCQKVTTALRRNGLDHVDCIEDAQGLRLTGHVDKEEDRAVAFALARTTMGTEKLINSIEVVTE